VLWTLADTRALRQEAARG